MMCTNHIDARSLKCPAPFIKMQKALQELSPGALVAVESDDPFFPPDCESWCKRSGHEIMQMGIRGGIHFAVIRHKG